MKISKTSQPIPYKITKEGSLSILALGAIGVKAWRKIRDEKQEGKNA